MASLAHFHPICGHGHNCAYILIYKDRAQENTLRAELVQNKKLC